MGSGIYRPQNTDNGIKEAADALAGGISQIGSIFKDRYDRKQYEDFLSGPAKDYNDQMKAAQDQLLDHDNPDAAQQAVNTLKNATNDFMDNATRFSDNPYIMAKAKRVWDGHMSFIKDEFTAKLQDAKVQTEQAKAANEKEIGPLNKQYKQSQIDLNKAKAANENAKAANPTGATKGAIQYLSGDPAQLSQIADPDARAEAAHTNLYANMNLPDSDPKRKAIDTGVKQELFEEAKQRVASKAARNETRPVYTAEDGTKHGGDKWNTGDPEHIKYMAGMIDPTVAKERFAIKAIRGEAAATGVDADVIERKYGAIVDPTKATSANPVTRPLTDDELGKVLLGSAAWGGIQVADLDEAGKPVGVNGKLLKHGATSLREAFQALPAKYDDLQKSPLTDAIDHATQKMTAKVKSGEIKLTEKDVEAQLKTAMIQDVVGSLIGGANVETSSLPEGLKRNRLEAKKFAEALASRYAKQIYNNIMGIQEKEAPAPKEPKSDALVGRGFLSKYTPVGTAADDYTAIKGLLTGKK